MTDQETTHKSYLADSTYNRLKNAVQLILPAFGALYFGLAQIWGLPAAEQVVGTAAVVATFLGVVLQVSYNRYSGSDAQYNGKMVIIDNEDGGKIYSLELDGAPEEMAEMNSVSFKVVK